MILKPDEKNLFWHKSKGGLGLISVRHKALAFLIKCFLEQCTNPNYIHSLFTTIIFRHYVMEEDISCPPVPSCYNESFFEKIKDALYHGYNISTMKTRDWYDFLLSMDESLSGPTKIELTFPEINWPTIWSSLRVPSLNDAAKSFAFKLLNKLLPCERRLSSILRNSSPSCRFRCLGNPDADLSHTFFDCQQSRDVGSWLIELVKKYDENATVEMILRLEVITSDAIAWVIIQTLAFIWERRSNNKKADLEECIASLIDLNSLLLDSKWNDTACAIQYELQI